MFEIKSYEDFTDLDEAVSFLDSHNYDHSILEWDMVVVVKSNGKIVGIGDYQYAAKRIEIVTDVDEVALKICHHFGDEKVSQVDCSNPAIAAKLTDLIDRPFKRLTNVVV